ncbi:MFS transporter [Candidatus Daviesbacteria bacterium]|nr:MFS transporter [Candidatus Daviesbacteria bacterium]
MDHQKAKNKLTQVIFLSQSIFSAGTVTLFTVLSISAFELSGQESFAGLPHSILIFTPALTAYFMRSLMNRISWRFGLTLGYIMGALGAVIGVWAIFNNSFYPILISAFFFGTARASGDLSRYAVGQMFEESKRARMIGRVVFASAIGGVVGPLIAPLSSKLAANIGLPPDSGTWGLAGFLYLLAGLVTLTFLYPDPNKVARGLGHISEEKVIGKIPSKVSFIKSFKLPLVQLAFSSMVISQLVMVVLMVMTPLHIHKLHYGNEVIGYVIAAHTLGMFGLAALTGYLVDKFGHVPMMFVGGLILASSVILAPMTTSGVVLAISLFLLGLGWNFGYVAGSSLLSSSLPNEVRSKIQGIIDSLIAFIAGLSSLGSGPLFAMGGYFALSMAGLLVTILLMILIYFLSRQHKVKSSLSF